MRRILHTMFRVGDLQRSINFYTQIIGMRVLRTLEQPDEQYTLTFLGFENETDATVLELTYNYGVSEYQHGNAFGHIAISVINLSQVIADIKQKGIEFSLELTQLKNSNESIAFLSDPDGYQIELIERPNG